MNYEPKFIYEGGVKVVQNRCTTSASVAFLGDPHRLGKRGQNNFPTTFCTLIPGEGVGDSISFRFLFIKKLYQYGKAIRCHFFY